MTAEAWDLLGDIGGTHARFALSVPSIGLYSPVGTYRADDCPDFETVLLKLRHTLEQTERVHGPPRRCCIAVASLPHVDPVRITNNHWQFTRRQLRTALATDNILLVNDLAAAARALPDLHAGERVQIGTGDTQTNAPSVAIGVGTGLGVSALLTCTHGAPVVVPSEGGHSDFAPVTDTEAAVLAQLRTRFGRVSNERLCSGDGILNIYRALAALGNGAATHTRASAIGDAAQRGDALAKATMALFFAVLGTLAGNLALTLGARGGVYITGGVLPHYIESLQRSDFRARFAAKGRFQDYVALIPTYVCLSNELGLRGAARLLEDH